MHLRIYNKDFTYKCAELPCTNFRYVANEEYFGSPIWIWRLNSKKKMKDWQWIIIKYAEARWHKSRRIRSWLKNVSLIIPARNSHFPNHRRELKFSVVSTIKYFNNQWNITIQSYRRESVIINFLIKGRQIYRYMWHAGEMRSMWHVWEWKELLAKFWWGYLRERDHLEDLGLDGRKIFRGILRKPVGRARIGMI